MFDPDALLKRLTSAGVNYIVVGGVAVAFHGAIRGTDDLDICPDPEYGNLQQLATVLAELHAAQKDVGDFSPVELPFDPTDAEDLDQGGNFRLRTALGDLDLMQWIAGIEADHAYPILAQDAVTVDWHGMMLQVCSLAHLRAMKQAASRPQDLQDLADLEIANG